MTSSHHGDTTVSHELHDGLSEFLIDIDHAQLVVDDPATGHARVLVTDRQFRDLMLCGGDLVPSMRQWSPHVQYAKASPPQQPPASEPFVEFTMCRQCGHRVAQIPVEHPTFCGDECEHNWRQSEYRGWYPR